MLFLKGNASKNGFIDRFYGFLMKLLISGVIASQVAFFNCY